MSGSFGTVSIDPFRMPTRVAGLALVAAHFSICRMTKPLPRSVSLGERLNMLPRQGVPLDHGVAIQWSEHQIPFIEAESDTDLATALGLVHAHLRIGQMEMLRYLSQGRVSELIGPIAIELDVLLRSLALGCAVPEILDNLPTETRQWLEAFVSGINHYLAHVKELPHEFDVLKIKAEPWSVSDVLGIGRLVAADTNWIVWFQLLRLHTRKDWPQLWRRLTEGGHATGPDPTSFSGADGLLHTLQFPAWRGSNSFAVSGQRSATGAALMANDPHLGVHQPGPWLIAAYKSPSHHAVGLMAPGLPFVAIGRNPWIAWGGTNLHAASSDFYDVSGLPSDAISERRETIRVRWWPDRHVVLRETALGPIISDARLLRLDRRKAVALRWMGHTPSDEFTAMLKVNQARNWDDFRAAINGISVPGQMMTYADVQGHVRRTMAAHLPARQPHHLRSFLLDSGSTDHWQRLVTGVELSADQEPQEDFVVSANEPLGPMPVPVGIFFSSPDRARRLSELIANQAQVNWEGLNDALTDIYMATSHKLSRLFVGALRTSGNEISDQLPQELVVLLAEWDGRYQADSRGALLFELVLYNFVENYYGEDTASAYWATWNPRSFVLEDLSRRPPAALAASLHQAVRRSARAFRRFRTWGGMHRLRLAHLFGYVQLFRGRYVLCDTAASGGSDSVYKTGHRFGAGRHQVTYGSSARHISDLSDLDYNYFVLLGGQDGWLGSVTYSDQLPLWQRNKSIQVPLRPATARAQSSHRTELSPKTQTHS